VHLLKEKTWTPTNKTPGGRDPKYSALVNWKGIDDVPRIIKMIRIATFFCFANAIS
jgi:hypothetical protein